MSPSHLPPIPSRAQPSPVVPGPLLAAASRGPQWAQWLDRLPRLAADLCREWSLVPDGTAMHGHTALVLPVLAGDGTAAALKIAFPGEEERHEILGLHTWAGDGAVRLLRGDPHRRALLLERLGSQDLRHLDDDRACEVVGGLYGRLHVPAPARLDPITRWVAAWADDLSGFSGPVPRRMVQQAVHLARQLLDDPDSTGTLVHTDLHHENVLAADRELWLAIDPKPMSGDPHYELAPMLFNAWERVIGSGDVRRTVRRRFHTLVDVAGLDEDRARDWVVVRETVNAMWAAQDDDQEMLTRHIAVVKAVQE